MHPHVHVSESSANSSDLQSLTAQLLQAIEAKDIGVQQKLTAQLGVNINEILSKLVFQFDAEQIRSWLEHTQPTIQWWSIAFLLPPEKSLISFDEQRYIQYNAILEKSKVFFAHININ